MSQWLLLWGVIEGLTTHSEDDKSKFVIKFINGYQTFCYTFWEGVRYLSSSEVEWKSICLTLPIEDVYKDIVFAEPKIREVKGLRLLE